MPEMCKGCGYFDRDAYAHRLICTYNCYGSGEE